eukprot:m.232840 g.232840  ORF g.232840 m.232840 type:complete len:111 (-) comp18889_c0_seq3:413-745(-)
MTKVSACLSPASLELLRSVEKLTAEHDEALFELYTWLGIAAMQTPFIPGGPDSYLSSFEAASSTPSESTTIRLNGPLVSTLSICDLVEATRYKGGGWSELVARVLVLGGG